MIGAPVDNLEHLGRLVSLVTREQLEIQVQRLLQHSKVTQVQLGPLVYQVHPGQPDLLDREDLQGTMASRVTLALKDPRDSRDLQEM